MSTAAPSGSSVSKIYQRLGSSPLICFLLGGILIFLWVGCTIVQIETSEYLALGNPGQVRSVSLLVVLQPWLMVTGQAPIAFCTAWMYAWAVELTTLVFAFALKVAEAKINAANPRLGKWYVIGGGLLIILNSYADYASSPGANGVIKGLIALGLGIGVVTALPLGIGLIEHGFFEMGGSPASAAAATTTGSAAAGGAWSKLHHQLGSSPLILFLLCALSGVLWISGTSVQIQTSEYLALGEASRQATVDWGVFSQPWLMVTGQAPVQFLTAWAYAWMVEILTLVVALVLGVAVAKIATLNPFLAKVFVIASLLLLVVNAYADYSSTPNVQPLVQFLIALAIGGTVVVGLPLTLGLGEHAVSEL